MKQGWKTENPALFSLIMNKKKCYIFGAGEFDGVFRKPERDDLIIAADGGISAASKAMLTPNLIIGDFDSYDGAIPEGAVVCPREKDDTDTGMAVDAGIDRGCSVFYIYGGLGGRLDHTLANIQTLASLANKRLSGWLLSRNLAVTAVCDSKIVLNDELREIYSSESVTTGYISVFAHGGDAVGVSLEKMKYKLDGQTLRCDYPLGVSNEAEGECIISVKSGTLIITAEIKQIKE